MNEIVAQDGLFAHHKSRIQFNSTHMFYMDFFGKGWHKRKRAADGFAKYQTALEINPETGEVRGRTTKNRIFSDCRCGKARADHAVANWGKIGYSGNE